jgi:hypothetical protein
MARDGAAEVRRGCLLAPSSNPRQYWTLGAPHGAIRFPTRPKAHQRPRAHSDGPAYGEGHHGEVPYFTTPLIG